MGDFHYSGFRVPLTKRKCTDRFSYSLETPVLVGHLPGRFVNHSGFPSERINLSPFTKDFRGGEHMMSL